MTLTEEIACERCQWGSLDLNFGELLLHSMRHVQHHAAQLSLLLRKPTDSGLDQADRAPARPRINDRVAASHGSACLRRQPSLSPTRAITRAAVPRKLPNGSSYVDESLPVARMYP
jgi:hypothetical protein